jgi:hypothetical protein
VIGTDVYVLARNGNDEMSSVPTPSISLRKIRNGSGPNCSMTFRSSGNSSASLSPRCSTIVSITSFLAAVDKNVMCSCEMCHPPLPLNLSYDQLIEAKTTFNRIFQKQCRRGKRSFPVFLAVSPLYQITHLLHRLRNTHRLNLRQTSLTDHIDTHSISS